jgi:hypothetical protein
MSSDILIKMQRGVTYGKTQNIAVAYYNIYYTKSVDLTV